MATASSDEDTFQPNDLCEDLLCCAICYERFNERRIPKALPCLHTFCKHCLQRSIDAHRVMMTEQASFMSSRNKKKNEFPCPICKDLIKIPENGLHGFKDDFRIRRISEVLAKRSLESGDPSESTASSGNDSSDSEDDMQRTAINSANLKLRKCTLCSFFKKSTEATKYCIECMKHLCGECSEKHLEATLTADHNLVLGEYDLPSETTCSLHAGEPLLYYCPECKTAVCMTCTLGEKHSGHSLKKLKEEALHIKSNIQGLLEISKKKIVNTESTLKDLDELEQELRTKEKAATRAILVKTIDEILKIKSKMSKMERELQTKCQGKFQVLEENRYLVQKNTEEAQKVCSILEQVSEHGQDLQLLYLQNKLCPSLEDLTKARSGELLSNDRKFLDLGKFDGFIMEQESSSTSEHENISKSSIFAEIRNVVCQMRTISTAHSVDNEYPQLVKVIGQKGTADGEFQFPSGVTCLDNGDAIIADMHNNRIQVFSKTGVFKHKFGKAPLKPCGVSSNREGNIVVTDCNPSDTSIKIFTPEGALVSTFGAGFLQYPFSVFLDNRGRYVVCDPSVNKVVILGQNGTLYRRFSTKTKFAFYIAGNSRDEILLSDWVNHCVRVFDHGGATLRNIGCRGYGDGQLMIPLGVCTDRHDNIYVVDSKCSRVSVFSLTGRFLRHAVGPEEGISRSRAISIGKDGTLVITSGDNRRDLRNDVRFYQL